MKSYLTSLLAGLLLLAAMSQPVAAKQGDTTSVEQIKIKVAKLGVGEKAKATVYLKNGTKIKGYVAQAADNDFVLRDRKTDAATTINYVDVAKVESNRGHSTARNLGIGIGIGAGALLLTILAVIAHLD
jgi:sRNA-binding regulator protein Hfq